MAKLCTHYDRSVDAATLFFRPRVKSVRTQDLDGQRFIDYDADGRVIGVELLDVTDGISLVGLPQPDAIRKALAKLERDEGVVVPILPA